MTPIYKIPRCSNSVDVKKWYCNRKENAVCKLDIEALFEVGNNPGPVHYEDALDELLDLHGLERVLYLLHITVRAELVAYGAKEREFVSEMAEVYGLTWADPMSNGDDFQYAYALDVSDVSGWNKLANALQARVNEEDSGKVYVVVEANNCSTDIPMSKPFARHREAWKLMKAIYDDLIAQDPTDGSISENAFSVCFEYGNRSPDIFYGEIKAITFDKEGV